MTKVLLPIALVSIALTACGGGPGGETKATCTPHGTSLQIGAANVAFDKECLAAPGNEAFTIAFDNHDANTPHNVSIHETNDDKELFKGEVFNGIETVTYHVPALPPGTYEFRCDVHPNTMDGAFIVG